MTLKCHWWNEGLIIYCQNHYIVITQFRDCTLSNMKYLFFLYESPFSALCGRMNYMRAGERVKMCESHLMPESRRKGQNVRVSPHAWEQEKGSKCASLTSCWRSDKPHLFVSLMQICQVMAIRDTAGATMW